MNNNTLPGQLVFTSMVVKPWRSFGAKPGNRYKIVPVQIAAPADLSDEEIIEAVNFALTNTYVDEAAPLADDWQFLARTGAVGDNDHFREAIIPTDDLFAVTPQAIFENWYLVPEGVQCPQCERYFTTPDDLNAIGDHALCTACLTAWRMTAAANNAGGDGYSEEPPFLTIPEWWAARGLETPADDTPPLTNERPDRPQVISQWTKDHILAPKRLTVDQVKETLPEVEVKRNGKIYAAKVRGRRMPFAEVYWETDCGPMSAEFAWETVTNAINNGTMLRA